MADTKNIVLAGFGGQGILFAGKVMAYTGLMEDKQVSWLPSYGPEMRGGTANCSVCISDEPIASPVVLNPNILIAMNLPSYQKFIDAVPAGGKVFLDSSLIEVKCERTDIDVYYVPATELSNSENLQSLANIILLGKVLKETQFASYEGVKKGIGKCVSARKAHLLEANMRAIDLGMSL